MDCSGWVRHCAWCKHSIQSTLGAVVGRLGPLCLLFAPCYLGVSAAANQREVVIALFCGSMHT